MENGFNEYKREFLYRLDSLDEAINDLHRRLDQIEKELLTQRLKSGMFGALAGCLPVGIAIVWQLVK